VRRVIFIIAGIVLVAVLFFVFRAAIANYRIKHRRRIIRKKRAARKKRREKFKGYYL
jgi:phosphotransferase system  glucose/maltose/N-acetylglucosamine-specific IIC component